MEKEILTHLETKYKSLKLKDLQEFTTSAISQSIHLSRSSTSKYLNEMIRDNELIKINSRPVYYLSKRHLEETYNLKIKESEYFSIGELQLELESQMSLEKQLIGANDSLKQITDQIKAVLNYKKFSYPIVINGEEGSGKNFGLRYILDQFYSEVLVHEFNAKDTSCCIDSVEGLLNESVSGEKQVIIIKNAETISENELYKLNLITRNNEELYLFLLVNSSDNKAYKFKKDLNYPIIINVPTFKERSYEEKIELVIHFLKIQALNLNVSISISNLALDAIITSGFSKNIEELKLILTKACLDVVASNEESKEIKLNVFDFKDSLQIKQEHISDSTIKYVSISNYERDEEQLDLLEYYEAIMDSYNKTLGTEQENTGKLINYLLFRKDRVDQEYYNYSDLVSELMSELERKYFTKLVFNFENTVSMLLLEDKEYHNTIELWEKRNQKKLTEFSKLVESIYTKEYFITEVISNNIQKITGSKMNLSTRLMLTLITHKSNIQSVHKISGLIVCHGYATASSIAHSVNTLVDDFIFDAIDMPLEASTQDIVKQVESYIEKTTMTSEIIVLVDMGSLETIDLNFDLIGKKQIAMINNVSLKLALIVGNEIKNNTSIVNTLQKAQDNSKSDYKILKMKESSDAILVTSESGLEISERIKNIFVKSLPMDTTIEVKTISENELIMQGINHHSFKDNNVLFISGTSDPKINDVPFIPIEKIISGEDMNQFRAIFAKQLSKEEIISLVNNVQKNFSLENVMNYLTILNPNKLLDTVVNAIENLELNLGIELRGTTKVGLYIHTSCMVERLLTKNTAETTPVSTAFLEENQSLLNAMHHSFSALCEHYRIEIPHFEMQLIYDYVKQSIEETDEMLYDWIV